jgi:hypothetical protein
MRDLSRLRGLIRVSPDLRGHGGPPPILYHYTGAAGALGIISKGEMWATDAAYLNDPTETQYGRELIRNCWEEFKKNARLGDQELRFFQTFIDVLDTEWHTLISTYLACFSEYGNVLSQWRAYGQPGTGYSLGFDSAKLVGNATGFSLLKVEYEPAVQRETIGEFFRYCTEDLIATGDLSDDLASAFYGVMEDTTSSFIEVLTQTFVDVFSVVRLDSYCAQAFDSKRHLIKRRHGEARANVSIS